MATKTKVSEALQRFRNAHVSNWQNSIILDPHERDELIAALPHAIEIEAEIEQLRRDLDDCEDQHSENWWVKCGYLEEQVSQLKQQIAIQAKGAEEASALMQKMEAEKDKLLELRGAMGAVISNSGDFLVRFITEHKAERDRFREALSNLVIKLEEVHNDEGYKNVWVQYQNHGFSYRGPSYARELKAAIVALHLEEQKD